MSGIAGIFYRNGRDVDPNLIEKMNNALSHRGPDYHQTWNKGPVGLGHQMLFTTPESLNEKLPFFDEKSGLSITADARIDNRRELNQLLSIEDDVNVPDSYYILKAYEKWADKCPEKLLGDYAFVVWDTNNEILFCARDHMGIKPFYYYISKEAFYFASEIKALLKIKDIPIKINETKIVDYLLYIFEDREITFYENIFRLPAAHKFKINKREQFLNQYWKLDPHHRINLASDREYEEALRNLFIESVQCRLRCKFPIGSELSGGLDSSSISCQAQKILSSNKNSIKTFSLVFPGYPNADESKYIDIVNEQCNLESFKIDSTRIDPLNYIENPGISSDEPLASAGAHRLSHFYNKVSDEGVRVLLSGFDGDSTLGSPGNYFVDLLKNKKIRAYIDEIRGYSDIHNINSRKMYFYTLSSLAPEFLKNVWNFFFKKTNLNYHEMNAINIMNDEFAEKIDVLQRKKLVDKKNENKTKGAFQWHYYHLSSGIFQHEMETLDKIAAEASIEKRYPFFDRRLLEFCLALPSDQKMKIGRDRIVMRRAMQNVIPEEIQSRYSKAIGDDVLNDEVITFALQKLENMINNDHSKLDPYINSAQLKQIYEEAKLNIEDGKPFELIIVILIYKLNHWLKQFRD